MFLPVADNIGLGQNGLMNHSQPKDRQDPSLSSDLCSLSYLTQGVGVASWLPTVAHSCASFELTESEPALLGPF